MREVLEPVGHPDRGLRLLVPDGLEIDTAVQHLQGGVEADLVEHVRQILANLGPVLVVVGVDIDCLAVDPRVRDHLARLLEGARESTAKLTACRTSFWSNGGTVWFMKK